jgi:ABC-type bacteriocin/lantibiotic exporter with double-glycine peptidase domain
VKLFLGSKIRVEGLRHSVSRVFHLLDIKDRLRIFLFIGSQLLTSVLDTLGILLIGVIASLSFSIGSQGLVPQGLSPLLDFFGIAKYNALQLLPIFGVSVATLLIVRTSLSLIISYRTYKFLAKKGSEVSEKLIRKLMFAPFWWVRKQSVHDLSFALTQGVQYSIIGVLGQYIILMSEICFLILLMSVLLWVNFQMAVVAAVFFFLFGSVVYLGAGREISRLAQDTSEKVVYGNQQIENSVFLFREIFTTSKQREFIHEFKESREESGNSFAKLNWIQLVPKFSVEIAVVLGAFFLAFASTMTSGFENAVSDIAIFLAATSRLAPSALRLQQSLITARSFAGQSHKSFSFFEELTNIELSEISDKEFRLPGIPQTLESIPSVNVKHLDFRFNDSSTLTLSDVSFEIKPGETVALIGDSGSGKSTLCDLILGLLTPTSGTVSINGMTSTEFVKSFPGSVSYLPQETRLLPGTIYENIAVGVPPTSSNLIATSTALKKARLIDFVDSLPNGINQLVGTKGLNLSGGQKQRIGLARALFVNPKLLILDEPTSSLDSETEDAIMHGLQNMKGECSILIIAHRLATLKFVNRIVYLEKGHMVASGNLDEIRKVVPGFDVQAGLQGL